MKLLNDTSPQEVMIVRLLEQRAAEAPNATFFTWNESIQTLGEFNASVNQVARNLREVSIGQGTPVAVLMDSSIEYMFLWFALAKIGAVEIPINTAYRGDLLAHVLSSSGAMVCVIDDKYCPNLDAVANKAPALAQAFIFGGGKAAACTSLPSRDFADLLAKNDPSNLGIDIACDAIGGIIFTSGTTGPSKGVMLSQHYLAAYGFMYAEVNRLANDDVIFNYLPFFHIGAKFLTIATLLCKGRMHLVARLSISTFWDDVRAQGVTNFIAVGGVCNMLLARPPSPDDCHTTIRTIYAVPDPADIHMELEKRFGCRITTVYGSTEAGLPIWRAVGDDYRAGSCGRESPYYDVQVVDENDNPVAAGVSGEIVVRPKKPFLICSGYVNMPDSTVRTWRNLWLHCGDRGRRDADGWFYFEDRLTDSIRRRGENISSYEVEQLVAKHPAVAEVAAVAAPSAVGEDEVWILVILRQDHQATYEDILLHCEATMPYFMIPLYIDIVDALPRTPTAKVEKYKLRKIGPGPATWNRHANGWELTRNGLVAPTARQGLPAAGS